MHRAFHIERAVRRQEPLPLRRVQGGRQPDAEVRRARRRGRHADHPRPAQAGRDRRHPRPPAAQEHGPAPRVRPAHRGPLRHRLRRRCRRAVGRGRARPRGLRARQGVLRRRRARSRRRRSPCRRRPGAAGSRGRRTPPARACPTCSVGAAAGACWRRRTERTGAAVGRVGEDAGMSVGAGAVVGDDGVARCPWGTGDPVNLAYHDTEWGMRVSRGGRPPRAADARGVPVRASRGSRSSTSATTSAPPSRDSTPTRSRPSATTTWSG